MAISTGFLNKLPVTILAEGLAECSQSHTSRANRSLGAAVRSGQRLKVHLSATLAVVVSPSLPGLQVTPAGLHIQAVLCGCGLLLQPG